MRTVEEAKKIISENLPGLKVMLTDIPDSLGLVIAEDVLSPVNIPGFTNSAMDGFAVKWENVKDFSNQEIKLKIIGESAAGVPFKGKAENNSAVRINTGALVPNEYDTVIPVENTDLDNDSVIIKSVKKKNQNVRYEGEEFKIGDTLLKKNTTINPAEIALLAGSGITKVNVYQPPKITIIVTGSELVDGKTELKEAQIKESNSLMLSSLFKQAGCFVKNIYKVGDSLQDTEEIIRKAETHSDLIIVSGGVSVGPHDHVKEAAIKSGFDELFWKVNQKPGKPLFFAKKNDVLLFGVPGNPVSALMCALYYILPVVIKLLGKEIEANYIEAFSDSVINNKQDRSHFMRAKILNDYGNKTKIEILNKQASHMLSTLTEADGFVLLEPNQEIKSNETINFYPFPWRRKWVI